MAFSSRIKKIASLIDRKVNVIDIGCDHALLDIYLTMYNENTCIATDINQKAIDIANANIKKYNLNIKTLVSNGFDKIDIPKNNTCVIAGMGTSTIKKILETEKTKLIDQYIIQTNNNYYDLRKYIITKGYYIDDEITFEDKKIRYIIMKFKKGKKNYSELELKLGPILMTKKDFDTTNYFKELYDKNKKILTSLPKRSSIQKKEIERLNKIIENYIVT